MERVVVALPDAPYDVVVGAGALAEVGGCSAGAGAVAVVSQPGVADWHAPGAHRRAPAPPAPRPTCS